VDVLGIVLLVLIGVGVIAFGRWSARRTKDISDYYDDFEDPTAEVLDRTNEMRAGRL